MRRKQVGDSSVVARRLLIAAVLLLAACSEDPGSSPGAAVPEETPPEVSDALLADAGEIAKDRGISVEDALAILERQPRVGRLQSALARKGPDSYGGTFLEYEPEYRIVLLALPGGADEVTRAVDELGFADLSAFVSVRETPYTEDVLKEAQRMVAQLGGSTVTTLDLDIRTGEILATVASSEDADALTAAVDAAVPPVPAPVVVTVPKGAGYVTGAVAEPSDISVHPARVQVGDRAQLRVDRGRATWGLPWILERLERAEETSWKWVGNLKAGPGKQWTAEFYIGHAGGSYEDIGFRGPASIRLVIPNLEAGRYRLGQEFISGGREPLEERLVWHSAQFEVVD